MSQRQDVSRVKITTQIASGTLDIAAMVLSALNLCRLSDSALHETLDQSFP